LLCINQTFFKTVNWQRVLSEMFSLIRWCWHVLLNLFRWIWIFLWFIWFFNELMLSLSMTNFCYQLHLHEVLNAIQSCNFVWINNNNKISSFSSKSASLLCTSIIYINTMCIKLVLTLHTLICLLIVIYSTRMSFHVQFRFDFTHFSFSM